MGFFDKVKETATAAKDKATSFAEEKNLAEKLNNAKDSVKKSIDDSTSQIKAMNAESKEMKKPLEGAIIRYEVIYIGGLPEYPKTKSGNAIGLNIMEDCFAFRKTNTSKEWFEDFDIPYSDIKEINIEKRNISTAEFLLGAGNDPNQQQENNICITFDREDVELILRVEMLTGVTIYNQAAKCKEFMDVLRQNKILGKFKKAENAAEAAPAKAEPDAMEQLKKLAELKDAGILTEEEFNAKKAELLARI